MRSKQPPPAPETARSTSDLTARARLRDAAIEVFGEAGFDASVRTIAARAGLSPALVIHHFGSKEKLRAACDEYIAALVAELKSDSVGARAAAGAGTTLLSQLATMDSYAWVVGYVMQSFRGGGPLAGHLFDLMVADAEDYIAEGVRQGTVHPSVDPHGRARFLASTGIGSLLLTMTLEHHGPRTDYAQLMQRWSTEFMVPALELYSYGFFTDDSVLQTYLEHIGRAGEPPTSQQDTAQ